MKKIRVIPSIQQGISCIVKNPVVVVPYLIYTGIIILIMVYGVSRIGAILPMFKVSHEMPFNILSAFFSLLAFTALAILLLGLLSPFIEGWTFAALASAHKNAPVSLKDAVRKAGSKYIGMLALFGLIVVISAVIGSIVSVPLSAIIYIRSFEMFTTTDATAIFISQLRWYIVMNIIVTVITTAVMVLFIYLKPAYIIGNMRLSESLSDGIDTARNNYVSSLVIFSIFTVLEVGISIGLYTVISRNSFINVESLMNFQNMSTLLFYLQKFIYLSVVLILASFIIRVILYSAITHAYMDSHEMLS